MESTMRAQMAVTIGDLMAVDPRIFVVFADISGGYFEDTSQQYPDRIINVGIREQLMVSAAAGMALEGMRPIAHSFAPFLVERAFEQVKLDFSHQGVGGILVSAGASYDTPGYGRTHQGMGDVALLATLPGWRITIPGHTDEVEEALLTAIESDELVSLRTAGGRGTVALFPFR